MDIDAYYALIGLSRETTPSEKDVKRAYRRTCLTAHPDKGGDPEKFDEIQQAYEFVLNHLSYTEQAKACVAVATDRPPPLPRRFAAAISAPLSPDARPRVCGASRQSAPRRPAPPAARGASPRVRPVENAIGWTAPVNERARETNENGRARARACVCMCVCVCVCVCVRLARRATAASSTRC